MKIIELLNSIQLPINNEEADLLAKFNVDPMIKTSQLDLHEQHIANQLVVKGVLLRKNNNGQHEYRKHIKD